MLTRAQWTALAYFVQQGCESFSKNPLARETWIGILKAFDAAHQLRTKPSAQDEYYLGNLPGDCRPERSRPSDPATAELVRKTVGETVRRMSSPATNWTPMLAARNLYVLLDGEKLAGAAALNEALAPYWPVLWRVAARGHYFERREPSVFTDGGTYVPTDATFEHNTTHEWNHGLGEIVTALLGQGMRITGLTEHDSIPWDGLPGQMEEVEGREFRLADRPWRLAHSYTLQAIKEFTPLSGPATP